MIAKFIITKPHMYKVYCDKNTEYKGIKCKPYIFQYI